MIDDGKRNVGGVLIDVVDYDGATERILAAARAGSPLGVSALAVHGVVEAMRDESLRYRINDLDLVTPDGMAVRWGLDLLHRAGLTDRCYGPELMRRVCTAAAAEGLPVFLYGSRPEVLQRLRERLTASIEGLVVAGTEPSKFRQVPPSELAEIASRVQATGARVVFAGLGCPRQEVFAYELRNLVGLPVVAVGAAFDYHAGLLREPPGWVQRAGLQWLWRAVEEPGRLWRRYATTNPRYVLALVAQRVGLWRPDPRSAAPPTEQLGHA